MQEEVCTERVSDDTRIFSPEVIEEVFFDCLNLIGKGQVFEIASGLCPLNQSLGPASDSLAV